MITFIISPFVLCTLLYLFARRNADYNIYTTFIVAGGIALGSFIINHAFGATLGFFIFVLIFLLSGFLILKFCYTTVPQTIVVTILFVAYLVFFSELTSFLFSTLL